MRSNHFLAEGVAAFEGVAGLQRVPPEFVQEFRVADVSTAEQQRIADFLDDRIARIARIINARRRQTDAVAEAMIRASYDMICGSGVERRPSGLAWLGSIPLAWPVLTVTSEFQVDLGKMLDEKRQTGATSIPYLRNINVQWDQISIDDLKVMDMSPNERPRYTVASGDLLICEGGQPGRAAIWSGTKHPLGFQKALHRARSRGRSKPEWLLECLRVAVHLNVFAVENGQTTIGHLTNEQLRSTRFPFPARKIQEGSLEELERQRSDGRRVIDAGNGSVSLLTEYKQALITAAVAGELDVTTSGSGIPG
ncbi:MAG: hypothetical protein ACRC0L_08555 [Angustibacter sp.]